MTRDDEFKGALADLGSPRSAKRRAGAKRLRRIGDERAGPLLLEALQREVLDKRTWETQYQMIMALGQCAYAPARPYLQGLLDHDFGGPTMQFLALGCSITKLGYATGEPVEALVRCMATADPMVIDGAMRAASETDTSAFSESDIDTMVEALRTAYERVGRTSDDGFDSDIPGFITSTVSASHDESHRLVREALRGAFTHGGMSGII